MTGIVNHTFGLAQDGTSPVPPGAGIYQILGSDFQATFRPCAGGKDGDPLTPIDIGAEQPTGVYQPWSARFLWSRERF